MDDDFEDLLRDEDSELPPPKSCDIYAAITYKLLLTRPPPTEPEYEVCNLNTQMSLITRTDHM